MPYDFDANFEVPMEFIIPMKQLVSTKFKKRPFCATPMDSFTATVKRPVLLVNQPVLDAGLVRIVVST